MRKKVRENVQSPLFLQAALQERIWGGKKLREFSYELSSDLVGECWGISAHTNGQSVVRDGKYKGFTLEKLWNENRVLFGDISGEKFPLLTKILDANQDLSIQVHPNNEFANVNENGEFGKTECWYIIDCKEGAEIIYGHHAQTKEEFVEMIQLGKWNELLRHVPIKPGDFFYVPSGTIHALCEGTLVLETQQSSDTTYRVYDYDRVDGNGNKRELHLDKALAVSSIPHKDFSLSIQEKEKNGAKITTFVKEQYFSVYKWEIGQEASFQQDKCFQLASVIEGEGIIVTVEGEFPLRKGDHFILPNTLEDFIIRGNVTLIVSHP
ncbi:mannose-6-phosphate isomerase, class I [Ectobacillus panaciterrae]|uniref:mannose-6-phosphate isomerase, class I n=1 Tax=Ectobacillus panaciterrae TaxID=363872 RepID=UPI000557B16D|nr:mannose-6-phosphate isomerase, class I [Ectobacillus panaciterrae]